MVPARCSEKGMAQAIASEASFPAARPARAALLSAAREAAVAILPPVLLLAGLVMLWEVLAERGIIPRFILPSPAAIAHEIEANSAVLIKHALATIQEALLGFAIGNTAAILLALLFAWSAAVRLCLYPLALVSRGVPIIAITPLLVLVFGRGLPPIVAVVTIGVSFPTLLNMVRGLQSADVEYHEMLHTLSASPLQRLRLIEIPASVPYLFAALKVSASIAFISALVAEWIGSNVGLGYLVVISGQYFKLPMLWAAIVTAAALTLIMLGIVEIVERLLWRWAAAPADL
jgi:NitT/TauT family transport system permease protein